MKLIAFDIGGVLATIDKTSLTKSFSPHAQENLLFTKDFLKLQRGLISPCTYFKKASLNLNRTQAQLEDLFSNMLHLHDNTSFLNKLSCPYIFASNINKLHYEKFISLVKPEPYALLYSALSFELHALKPEPEFFLKLVLNTKFKARHIVFIDDKPANIKAAHAMGLSTALCSKPSNLQTILLEQKFIARP